MAKVLAEPGRYFNRESMRRRRKALALALMLTAVSFAFVGFLAGHLLRKSPLWTHAVVALGFIYLLRTAFVQLHRLLETAEPGASTPGDSQLHDGVLMRAVRELPDQFEIAAGLGTPFGSLEQVVIGPTGVFVLEAKNWKGIVSIDNHGELLWNGHPTDRPFVREFESRLEKVRLQVAKLVPGFSEEIQGLFVLTSADIENAPESRRRVHFLREHQVLDHILNAKPSMTLGRRQVEALAQAILSLARMESEAGGRETKDSLVAAAKS